MNNELVSEVIAFEAIAVYLSACSIALKPTVTEAEFPFKNSYKMNGKTVTIDDVYKVIWVPNDADDNHKGCDCIGNSRCNSHQL